MSYAGVVLAGGRSRRMGTDKALLRLGGVAAVRRVADAVRHAGPVFVVARPGQDVPVPDATVLHDELEAQGPLPALALGLRAARGAEAAMVCATDVPLLVPAVVAALLRLLGDHDVVLPVIDGRDQLLTAVYRTSLCARAHELVAAGERRVRRVVRGADVRRVEARELLADEDVRRADPALDSFRSANTPAQWAIMTATFAGLSLHSSGDQLSP